MSEGARLDPTTGKLMVGNGGIVVHDDAAGCYDTCGVGRFKDSSTAYVYIYAWRCSYGSASCSGIPDYMTIDEYIYPAMTYNPGECSWTGDGVHNRLVTYNSPCFIVPPVFIENIIGATLTYPWEAHWLWGQYASGTDPAGFTASASEACRHFWGGIQWFSGETETTVIISNN